MLHDTRSVTFAAVADWDYPLSREGIVVLEQTDVLLARWMGKKYQPGPKPWDRALAAVRNRRIDDVELHRKLRPHLYR